MTLFIHQLKIRLPSWKNISQLYSGNMSKSVLNVAEKNDAAKHIAKLLSSNHVTYREGLSPYNKIYEFSYSFFGHNTKFTMTSVSGHILNYAFSGMYKSWKSCNPVMLFDAPLTKKLIENNDRIKNTLEREIRRCYALIIWTDCDREGENIGADIVEICKSAKPNIQIYRARFSEITVPAVRRAMQNLDSINENMNAAVNVRQQLDLRIGASFTRFLSLRYQKFFPQVLGDQLISYGPCQFPTLGFVVERYRQVADFVSEPFWKIVVSLTSDSGSATFSWARQRLFDETACSAIFEHCCSNPKAKIINVSQRPKSKWRPVALDTVELEKTASRKLRLSAIQVMRAAEKLYTQGFISYPRTETNIFPATGLDLRTIIEQQCKNSNWGEFASRILNEFGGPSPRNGHKTDQAHPPIHPLKAASNLSGNEKSVYEFITRHFLACVSRDAQGSETTVDIELADEKFSARGLIIHHKNYLDVYKYDKWVEKSMPNFEIGQEFLPSQLDMIQGETEGPNLLTEADLIALMDKHGIGTDATHAEHIETIKNRLYVGLRNDGRLVPGELGMGLVEGYDLMGFHMSKPYLRASLENDLKKICDGTKSSEEVLRDQINNYRNVYNQAARDVRKLDDALAKYFGRPSSGDDDDNNDDSGGGGRSGNISVPDSISMTPVRKCPACGSDMILKQCKNSKWMVSCMSFPECNCVIWLPASIELASVVGAEDIDFGESLTCTRKCGKNNSDVKKLKLTFKKGQTPPGLSKVYVGCVGGCDELLSQFCEIYGPKISSQSCSNHTRSNEIATRLVGVAPPLSSLGNLPNNRNESGSKIYKRNISCTSTNQPSPTTKISNVIPVIGQSSFNFDANGSPFETSGSYFRDSYKAPQHTSSSSISETGLSTSVTTIRSSEVPLTSKIVCSCDKPTVVLTVKKNGPNRGRIFHKCATSTCDFFIWGDDAENVSPKGNNSSEYISSLSQKYKHSNSNCTSWNDNLKTKILCRCNHLAKRQIVNKEGGNKGRHFFSCSKPKDNGSCGFFQWADQPASGSSFSRKNNFNDRQKIFASGMKRRRCGICGNTGHNRKSCPNK